MDVPAQPHTLTVQEWAAEDDAPGEFVDGRRVDEEMPSLLHKAIVMWLGALLSAWLAPGQGWVLGSETKFLVGRGRGRKADLSVYLKGAVPSRHASLLTVPPHLIIEVLSPDKRDQHRDRVQKVAEYATFGVKYYWIVDPINRLVNVHELTDDGRYVVALAEAEGRHDVPGCDGLALDLDALWAHVDALPGD